MFQAELDPWKEIVLDVVNKKQFVWLVSGICWQHQGLQITS